MTPRVFVGPHVVCRQRGGPVPWDDVPEPIRLNMQRLGRGDGAAVLWAPSWPRDGCIQGVDYWVLAVDADGFASARPFDSLAVARSLAGFLAAFPRELDRLRDTYGVDNVEVRFGVVAWGD